MCTGQIYLVTLVTVIQYIEKFDARAILFLIIYNIALILPIIIVTIVMNRGKNIFQISEFARKKIPVIKIINIIVLIIAAIFIIIS